MGNKFVAILAIALIPLPTLHGADDSAPPPASDVIRKGITFLTEDAKRWMAERNCVSCHHPTLGIWALNEAKRRGRLIDEKALNEMTSWALTTYKKRNPDVAPETRQGYWNSTLEGTYLAFAVGSGPLLDPEHRKIVDHLVKRLLVMQEPDGSWKPFAYWAPLIDKHYFNTAWTYLALSQHQDYEKTILELARARAKALQWLDASATDDHHQELIVRLLLWKQLGKPRRNADLLLQALKAQQNPDGGWSQTPKMASDALATGQSLYVFALAGQNPKDATLQNAQEFLRRTQLPDGSWPMTSRPPARGKPTDNMMPITYAATAWATVGLLETTPDESAKTVDIVIETDQGVIELTLDAAKAPTTVANFLRYADGKSYDGGRFHRTVKPDNQPDNKVKIGVIQAGIRISKPAEEFAPIKLERTRDTKLSHKDGTISMARDGPDTATSDFFICIGDQPELDFSGKRNPDGQGFAAFGRVTKGMDVVRRIQQAPSKGQELSPPIRITRIARKP